MSAEKLVAGSQFPKMDVPKLGGGTLSLGTPSEGFEWQMIVVYRGKHCPRCTAYLTQLKDCVAPINELGIEVVVVSGDTQVKVEAHLPDIEPNYPVGYGLSIAQMRELGLYISEPRDAAETDEPFSEPGLFVINDTGAAQVIDIGNASWTRPELSGVVAGLTFIRSRNIVVRGTL